MIYPLRGSKFLLLIMVQKCKGSEADYFDMTKRGCKIIKIGLVKIFGHSKYSYGFHHLRVEEGSWNLSSSYKVLWYMWICFFAKKYNFIDIQTFFHNQ